MAGERYQKRPKRRKRTYDLEWTTIERVTALANELGVYPSGLVDLLLQRALDDVQSGRWILEAKPVSYVPMWSDK